MYKRNKSVALLLLLWVPPLPERGIKGERERLKKYYCPIKQEGAPFGLKFIATDSAKIKVRSTAKNKDCIDCKPIAQDSKTFIGH